MIKKIARLISDLFSTPMESRVTDADILDAKQRLLDVLDPLDPLAVNMQAAMIQERFQLVPASSFSDPTTAMDSIATTKAAMAGAVIPTALMSWYFSQTFIGFQLMGIIAQHWLVNKACGMMARDAVRNGYELIRSDGEKLDTKTIERIQRADKKYRVRQNLEEFGRFTNIFGIRIAIFDVVSSDPEYYTKPFNIDGITPNSYRGISQVDPNWCTPILTGAALNDATSQYFYEPTYWMINGMKYHRSHLIIGRTEQPADVLKPTYQFAGISLTQQIFERIYAAERSANESPLLLMTKRTTSMKVDTNKVATNQRKFEERLTSWMRWRDNFAVLVHGEDEELNETDTTLSDVGDVVMQQYMLVSSIAEIPVARLLGTSPSGLNATGEFEMSSYYDSISTVQENRFSPLVDRHHQILARSMGLDFEISHNWRPLDTPTAEVLATVNKTKADTDQVLVLGGIVSPDEARQRLRQDPESGYNFLSDDEDGLKETPSNTETQ